MRAKNREINIFNMSLLDILTGMLGAFLFLMLGLLPYYAKVSKNKDMNPEELRQLREENKSLRDQTALQQQQIGDLQKQLDDLQKIVKQSGSGPMTADQIQQLMDQMNQLRQQVAQLQQQLQTEQNNAQQLQSGNGQLQGQVAQMQQQLDQTTKEKNFWKAQQGTLAILSFWDSASTDIDVMAMAPNGAVYSPKQKDKFFDKDCIYEGDDSHAGTIKYNHEGLLVYLEKTGDYLIFYRVPQNATPTDYVNLRGSVLYTEVIGETKGCMVIEDSLGNSKAALAKPGGYYAWAIITYDAEKQIMRVRPPSGNLPKGIVLPQLPPIPPATPSATPLPASPPPLLPVFSHAPGVSPASPVAPSPTNTPHL